VEPIGVSWLARAFMKMRLKDKTSALGLQWREVPAADSGMTSRALTVDLTPLKPGRYRVQLTLTTPGQLPIVAEREIEIVQ
jgi:hypothetical protein